MISTAQHVARRLADHTVLAHDPAVPAATAGYWELSRAIYAAVDSETRTLADIDAGARATYAALVASPTDPDRHRMLAQQLVHLLKHRPAEHTRLAMLTCQADKDIWLDIHLGDRYIPGAVSPNIADLRALTTKVRTHDQQIPAPYAGGPAVNVIVPFRDRSRGGRTRNLLACLLALRDQDYIDGPLHITVVETDDRPHLRELIEPLADRHIFAIHNGRFNKSWTSNLGLAADGGRFAATCILDADILVDRSFVRRNVRRFLNHGHTAQICCARSLSLDASATAAALDRRCVHGAPDVPLDLLRGVLLREPPGGALWARGDALHRVGGFDERFEGWGGEDEDVVRRLAADGELRRWNDPLLHLDHPRPSMRTEQDLPFNAHIRMGSWTGAKDYGDPRKYTATYYTVETVTGTPRPPGPLMWGQRLLWNDSQWMGAEAHYFNLHVTVPVPAHRDLPTVLACLQRLLQRHEALRSRITQTPGHAPLQQVPAAASIDVMIVPAEPETADQVLETSRAQLLGHSFQLSDEWPVRPVIVTVDVAPVWITLVISHVYADGGAAALLSQELTDLLAGGPGADLPEPVPQPFDRVQYETSPAGRRLSAVALTRAEKQLRTMPQTNFPGPLLTPDRSRFRRMEMCSPALTEAVRRIADRHTTSTSTVLLAAVAVALAGATGNQSVVFKTVLGNRAFPELTRLVGNTLSNAIVQIETSKGTFPGLLHAIARTSMENLLYSQCDPDSRDALTARIGLERGVNLRLSTFYNDVRANLDQRSAPRPELDLAALTEHTTKRWIGEWARQDATFFFHTRTVGDCTTAGAKTCDHVYAMVDTAHLASAQAERLLHAVEQIAVCAAGRDPSLSELTAIAGLTPPERGPEWLHLDHCLVRLSDVIAAVAAALPGLRTEVFVTAQGDPSDPARENDATAAGPGIVAHIACDESGVGPAELHRAVVAVLPAFHGAVAPDEYVLHPVPRIPVPIGDRAAWERLPVLAQGSGRPVNQKSVKRAAVSRSRW